MLPRHRHPGSVEAVAAYQAVAPLYGDTTVPVVAAAAEAPAISRSLQVRDK